MTIPIYEGTGGPAPSGNTDYPDMHCPAIGGSEHINFWKSSCEIKQTNPVIKQCYKGCAYIRKLNGLKPRR